MVIYIYLIIYFIASLLVRFNVFKKFKTNETRKRNCERLRNHGNASSNITVVVRRKIWQLIVPGTPP